jgi:trk system potassium uptake protein TrkA
MDPAQNAGMHIIVLGCGRTGSDLALSLDASGHSVAIVDRDRDAFRRLPERFTGRAVLGGCINQAVLEQAGIAEAEAVAAVTSGDNSNIVAARIAREHYEVKNVVARIKDPRRAEIYQRLGIPTVATLTWTTNQVLRRLFPGDAAIDWTHPSGSMHLLERDLSAEWAGHKLDPLCNGERFRLVAVTRAGEAKLAVAGMVGQEGDLLHLLVHDDATTELDNVLAEGGAHQ